MATERQWNAVPPVSLTADGTTNGVLQITDTAGFFFGMEATLKNNLSQQLTVYIKMVIDSTTMWVGATKGGLDHNVDVSAFTVVTASTISAAAQNKSTVPMEGRMLATYETDPINAWRVRPVDPYGNGYTDSNPLPVAFDGTVSIGDVHILGPAPSNNELDVNSDGSINVNVVSTPPIGNAVISTYGEANSVVNGSTTTVVSYTVPGGITTAILERISVSGENIAKYTIFINATQIDTRRTFYGSSLSEYFEFTTGTSNGLEMNPGDIVTVKVLHNKPYVADFEGRIQVLQIT